MTEHYIEHLKFSACIQSDVEVISVIRTRLLRMGKGTEDDPIRRITQYWDFEGKLLWEDDPYKPEKKKAKVKRKK